MSCFTISHYCNNYTDFCFSPEDNKVNDWLESMDSTNADTPDSTENGDNKDNTIDNKDNKETLPEQTIDTSNDNKGNNNIEEKPLKDPSIIDTNSQQATTDDIDK